MNWYKQAITKMKLDWDTAYKELLGELGREPSNEEVRKKMYEDFEDSSFIEDFDSTTNYNPLLDNDLEFK